MDVDSITVRDLVTLVATVLSGGGLAAIVGAWRDFLRESRHANAVLDQQCKSHSKHDEALARIEERLGQQSETLERFGEVVSEIQIETSELARRINNVEHEQRTGPH